MRTPKPTHGPIVRPYDVNTLTAFLRTSLRQDVLTRLEVGYSFFEVADMRALATAPRPDNILRPIPEDKFVAPGELLVIPRGRNSSVSRGDYVLDDEGSASVMAWAEAWGNVYSADYEHAAMAVPPIRAPAAAWYNLEMRPEGLMARDMLWLPEAAEDLRTFKYRYWSPSIIRDRETGRVYVYLNFALTNIPATDKMRTIIDVALEEMSASLRPPVVQVPATLSASPPPVDAPAVAPPAPDASQPVAVSLSSRMKEKHMEYLLSLLGLAALPADQQQSAITNAITALQRSRDAVCALLGLGDKATPQEVTASVKSLTEMRTGLAQLFGLSGPVTLEGITSAVGTLKANTSTISARAEELARFQSAVMSLLGVEKPEAVADALGELKKLSVHVGELTQKTKLAEQVPTLMGFKSGSEQVPSVSEELRKANARIAELEKAQLEKERDTLLDSYSTKGLLPPAGREAALSIYGKFGMEGLKAHLEALPSTPASRPPEAPPATGPAVTAPSTAVALAAKVGIKPDAVNAAYRQITDQQELIRKSRQVG